MSKRRPLRIAYVMNAALFCLVSCSDQIPADRTDGTAETALEAEVYARRPQALGVSTESEALEAALTYGESNKYITERSRVVVYTRRWHATDRYWAFRIGGRIDGPGTSSWVHVYEDGRVLWFLGG